MKPSFQCLSINAYGVINTKWTIPEISILTFDGACARAKLILYIASVVEDLIELIAHLNFSLYFRMRFNKELVKSLAVLEFQVQLFREFADNVDGSCLWSWE